MSKFKNVTLKVSPVGIAPTGRTSNHQQTNTHTPLQLQKFHNQKAAHWQYNELQKNTHQNGFGIPYLSCHGVNVDSGGHAEDEEEKEDIPGYFVEDCHSDKNVFRSLAGSQCVSFLRKLAPKNQRCDLKLDPSEMNFFCRHSGEGCSGKLWRLLDGVCPCRRCFTLLAIPYAQETKMTINRMKEDLISLGDARLDCRGKDD